MSKKDYQALARAIHAETWPADPSIMERRGDVVNRLVRAIASALAADNPRFSRERFIEACETGQDRPKRKARLPLCAQAMGCLCAAHAKGRKASGPCDANEQVIP